ncbi:hypothetical protein BJX96DRAFT_167180 [Aspergillus floccosus]
MPPRSKSFTQKPVLFALAQAIKGDPMLRNSYLRLYRQPNYGQVRCISPSEVSEDWMCNRVLHTSRRVRKKPLRMVLVLTSDKEVKILPFIDYMRELYGHKGLRRIEDAITSIEADNTLREEIYGYHRRLIRTLLPFTVNFDFLFISVYDAGSGKYVHLALWRYSGQDREEPTYGSAVYYVFPDINSKNWHRFVARDRSEYQVEPTRAWKHVVPS